MVAKISTRISLLITAWVPLLLLVPLVSHGQTFFVDDTSAVGGPFYVGESWGAAWGDFNGDAYPDLFSSNHGTLNSILRNNGDGTFSEIVDFADSERVWTSEPSSDIHGGTFGDIDNDGDQDMVVTRSSIGARIHVMRNSGLGGFEEVGGALGIGGNGGGRMPIFFDYDNDSFLDIAYARVRGNGAEMFNWSPSLNRYVKRSNETGFNNQCVDNSYGLASDLFNDDKTHYLCASERSIPEKVFDTSTIPFTNVSTVADQIGTNADAVLADFNNDLKMDLFATRGSIRPSGAQRISSSRIEAWFSVSGNVNNEKTFTFKANGPIEVTAYARAVGQANRFKIGSTGYVPSALPVTIDPADPLSHGVVAPRNIRGVYVGYDDVAEEWTVYLSGGGLFAGAYITVSGVDLTDPTVTGIRPIDLPIQPRMLLNDGSRLVNSGSRGIGTISCNSIAAADFDNDMDVDLYLACATSTENINNQLYLNDGAGNFSLSSSHGGEGPVGAGIDGLAGTAESVVAADYNVDGKMDLFVTNGARLFPNEIKDDFSGGGPNTFIKNVVNNGNHWLQFDLQGVASNRDGFGAKVIVTAGGVWQMREQNGMYHRWSHDSRRLHFGLGANTTADITVEWPDGTVDTYTNVAADKIYRAIQDDALNEITPALNAPSVAVTGDSVIEGGTASVTVEVFPPSQSAVTVDYNTVDLDAISTLDYSPVTGTLTFDPLQTEKTITVDSLLDIDDESDEKFEIRLSNPVAASLNQEIGTIQIDDDDDGGVDGPMITVSTNPVTEGGVAVFIFELSEVSTETVTVRYVTSDETATSVDDYQPRAGKVTFLPGQVSSGRQAFTYQDTEIESDETFVLELSEVTNANILENRIVATILDDDTVIPAIDVSDVSVDEGEPAQFTVSLSEAATSVVTVNLDTVAGSADSDVDYQALFNDQIVFQPGEILATRTINTIEDSSEESDETFSVVLSSASNATIADGTGVGTIVDDDAPPIGPDISISDGSITEGGKVEFTVTLSASSNDVITVDFNTVGGTATSGVDYQPRSNGRITFQPGELSMIRRITTIQDSDIELDETFSLQLSNPTNATIADGVGAGIIIDDDGAPVGPDISISDASADEGGRAIFIVTLSAPSTDVITVEFNTVAGTATSGVDYQPRVNGFIAFQPGEVSMIRRVTTIQDTDIESDETFSIQLSNSTNAIILDGVGAGTIVDDDSAPPGPDISISDASITEGGKAAFTVSLSAPSTDVITVDFNTVAGTATSGVDYQPRSNGRVTFQPGVVSAIRRVTTLQDTLVEGDEGFTLVLSNAINATILDSIGGGIILDDD